MTQSGGYGFLVSKWDAADKWWAESPCKVMKDAPFQPGQPDSIGQYCRQGIGIITSGLSRMEKYDKEH